MNETTVVTVDPQNKEIQDRLRFNDNISKLDLDAIFATFLSRQRFKISLKEIFKYDCCLSCL
jgi:hypothetical protein